MQVGLIESLVRWRLICIDIGSVSDILQNGSLQSEPRNIRHYLCANLAGSAVKHSNDNSLPRRPAELFAFSDFPITNLFFLVHVAELAADEGFIYFHFAAIAAHFEQRAVL